MKWYVYRHDFNKKTVEKFNVFNHAAFDNKVRELFNEYGQENRKEFSEQVKQEAQYYFWSRCEHEVVVTSWPPYISSDELARLNKEKEAPVNYKRFTINLEVGKKIDIYDQLLMNWDAFIQYIYMTLKEGE